MRRYAGLLLDVDGTLVDSNDAHAHAWLDTFPAHDVEVSFSRVRRMIGLGGDRLIEQVMGIARDSRKAAKLGEQRSRLFLDGPAGLLAAWDTSPLGDRPCGSLTP